MSIPSLDLLSLFPSFASLCVKRLAFPCKVLVSLLEEVSDVSAVPFFTRWGQMGSEIPNHAKKGLFLSKHENELEEYIASCFEC